MIQKSGWARIAHNMSSLLSSAVPLLEAVELTEDSTENTVMRQSLNRSRMELLAGNNFSDALVQESVLSTMVVDLVRKGESAENTLEHMGTV